MATDSGTLTGMRALVGGSSRGIGLGCATALAAAGATVTVVGRDHATLEDARLGLPRPQDQEHDRLEVDFSDWKAVNRAVVAHLDEVGPTEILIHNTGGPPPGLAKEAEPDQYEAGFAMHLLTGQALVRAMVPGMVERRYGRIINIISSSVVTPLPNLGVSNTIRGAVAQWGRTLAAELGPEGITVNNVLPGSIDTSRLRSTMARIAERTGSSVAEIEARTVEAIPAGRLGDPADIGRAVAFLASPAAGYINGVNLPIDGGKTAVQ